MAYIRKEYTPEERAAYNAQKQAEMDEIIKRIDEGVKAVFQSDKYKEYLNLLQSLPIIPHEIRSL